MRLLVLGGTRFVGRAVVEQALERGRAVSVPGLPYKVVVHASRLVPSALQRSVVHGLRGRLPGRRT